MDASKEKHMIHLNELEELRLNAYRTTWFTRIRRRGSIIITSYAVSFTKVNKSCCRILISGCFSGNWSRDGPDPSKSLKSFPAEPLRFLRSNPGMFSKSVGRGSNTTLGEIGSVEILRCTLIELIGTVGSSTLNKSASWQATQVYCFLFLFALLYSAL